jgi:hypothetical protein
LGATGIGVVRPRVRVAPDRFRPCRRWRRGAGGIRRSRLGRRRRARVDRVVLRRDRPALGQRPALDRCPTACCDCYCSRRGRSADVDRSSFLCSHWRRAARAYGCGNGYGNYIYLKATDATCAVMAHLSRIDVNPGQQVARVTDGATAVDARDDAVEPGADLGPLREAEIHRVVRVDRGMRVGAARRLGDLRRRPLSQQPVRREPCATGVGRARDGVIGGVADAGRQLVGQVELLGDRHRCAGSGGSRSGDRSDDMEEDACRARPASDPCHAIPGRRLCGDGDDDA